MTTVIAAYTQRLRNLSRAQAALSGGGWTNRDEEALPALNHALSLQFAGARVVVLPTPTSEPCDEVDKLHDRLCNYPGVEFSPIGAGQIWPDRAELLEVLAWANVIVVPGGNFPDYMQRLADDDLAGALTQTLVSGSAVMMGSSNGTVSLFDSVHTADVPKRDGGGTNAVYRMEAGLGIIPGFVCAHYNERNEHSGIPRAQAFQEALRHHPGAIGFGIDTQAAFVLDRGIFRVFTRDRYAHIQKIVVEDDGTLQMTRLTATGKPMSLEDLYTA